ncbi:MAG: hypothetical protein ACLUZ6_02585 [Lachnospira eligens]
MEYVLKNTTVYEDSGVVNVHSPVLTPEERKQREKSACTMQQRNLQET